MSFAALMGASPCSLRKEQFADLGDITELGFTSSQEFGNVEGQS
jgi:hypothetical protein